MGIFLGMMAFTAALMFMINFYRTGGWQPLARRFPARERPRDAREQRVPGAAPVQLNRSWMPVAGGYAYLTVSPKGFELAPMLQFHSRFWVPWQGVASVTEIKALGTLQGVRIAFHGDPNTLRVWRGGGRALRDNCPPALLVRK